jgi:ribonuclease HI
MSAEKRAVAYTDGAARGNPGPAGAGVHMRIGDEWHGFHRYLGETTNNQAEYAALLLALEEAAKAGVTHLEVYADSELMVKQINGEYRVKNAALKPVFAKAQGLIRELTGFSLSHVRRENNQEADALANQAIDLAG